MPILPRISGHRSLYSPEPTRVKTPGRAEPLRRATPCAPGRGGEGPALADHKVTSADASAAFTIRSRDGLTTEVFTNESVFDALGDEWRGACARMRRVSIFITPEYIGTAWKHLRREADQPWVMVVRDAGRLVGLLPLVRSRREVHGLAGYELRHMGMWEGDRPGLIATIPAQRVWQALFTALRKLRSQWQWLDLAELDEGEWPLLHFDRLVPLTRGMKAENTQAAFLELNGTWESYLAGRSRNTRQSFLRRQRQLMQDHPDWAIEVIDDPQSIAAAFARYVEIERRGWKAEAGVGLWSDTRQLGFYSELLPSLARRGLASVWFLRIAGKDAAGLVRFSWGEVAYERLSAYDPEFTQYSPSTLLCMEAVRRLFGTAWRESDVLGMSQPLAERPSIAAWYDGRRQTHRIVLTNLATPMALWLAGHAAVRRIARRLRGR
jgi:CelD/BcsL family acetyltransferase involved in cellulose biosynthesis